MKRPAQCAEQPMGCKTLYIYLCLPRKMTLQLGTSTWKHATVAKPRSRAMAPEKCHFQVKSRDRKNVPKVLRLPRSPRNTTNHETQSTLERMNKHDRKTRFKCILQKNNKDNAIPHKSPSLPRFLHTCTT